MSDLAILKKVAAQELVAEKRYAEQISVLSDGEIKEVLADLKEEEWRHKEECVVILKSKDKKFNAKEFDNLVDMNLNTLMGATLPDIVSFLQLDIEKELEAKKLYEGYVRDLQDEKLKIMLTNFVQDEADHIEKLHALLNKLQ
jgi:rubrerythrin